MKNDWAVVVDKDLYEIDVKLSHSQIAAMNQEKFKSLVKSKVKESAFRYLISKKMSHSKVINLEYSCLEIAHYLRDTRFSSAEKSTLLNLRTSMTLVKNNYRSINSLYIKISVSIRALNLII